MSIYSNCFYRLVVLTCEAAVLLPLGPEEAYTFSWGMVFKLELELLRIDWLTETLQLLFSMLWFFILVTMTFLGRRLLLWPLLKNTGNCWPAPLSMGWGTTFYMPLVAPIASLKGFPLETWPLDPWAAMIWAAAEAVLASRSRLILGPLRFCLLRDPGWWYTYEPRAVGICWLDCMLDGPWDDTLLPFCWAIMSASAPRLTALLGT